MDAKDFKKLLKAIKFPSGKGSFIDPKHGYARWEKASGHAGAKTLSKVREAALRAGFASLPANITTDATGDRVSRGSTLVMDGVSVTFYSHYGQTAYENHFSITVNAKG